MKFKLIHEQGGERTYVLVFQTGDDAMVGLNEFIKEHKISAARFTAIGALSEAVLGYYDWKKKGFRKIYVDEQVELLSMLGDVALSNGEPTIHAHAVLGRSDGSTRGGHLIVAYVRPTLELVLVESPAHLRKRLDPESGLMLIDL